MASGPTFLYLDWRHWAALSVLFGAFTIWTILGTPQSITSAPSEPEGTPDPSTDVIEATPTSTSTPTNTPTVPPALETETPDEQTTRPDSWTTTTTDTEEEIRTATPVATNIRNETELETATATDSPTEFRTMTETETALIKESTTETKSPTETAMIESPSETSSQGRNESLLSIFESRLPAIISVSSGLITIFSTIASMGSYLLERRESRQGNQTTLNDYSRE